MASSGSQIGKPRRGRPKRAELPDVNINTGAQSIKQLFAKKFETLIYISIYMYGEYCGKVLMLENIPGCKKNTHH